MRWVPSLEIAVLRQTVDALTIVVIVYVKVGTDAKRLARQGEVSVWIDKRGTITWDEGWMSSLWTDANGQVGWSSLVWPGDRFRLVAKHVLSGALVTKVFEVAGNIVTKEEPQVQEQVGTPMPPEFKQEIRHIYSVKKYPGYGYATIP